MKAWSGKPHWGDLPMAWIAKFYIFQSDCLEFRRCFVQSTVLHAPGQTPPFQHCLHMRNLDSDLDCLFIFRCKHSQLLDTQGHANMACNQWLGTWDVAIIYTGGTRICVTVQWMSVDCMTLSPAKLNLIWTAAVDSRVMTWESQTQSWSIASVHLLHYFVAKTHSYLTVCDR